MQAVTTTPRVSYSELPVLCIPIICRELGQSGSQPIVRVRTVNQDFHAHSGAPLAETLLWELKQVEFTKVEQPEERLRLFRHYIRALKIQDYLPKHLRKPLLSELCRIVNTLPNAAFESGWREMVGQFNAETEEMRSQLQADMDKCAGRCDMYGDGGVQFTFKTPAW